jgi:hypothetical protein
MNAAGEEKILEMQAIICVEHFQTEFAGLVGVVRSGSAAKTDRCLEITRPNWSVNLNYGTFFEVLAAAEPNQKQGRRCGGYRFARRYNEQAKG